MRDRQRRISPVTKALLEQRIRAGLAAGHRMKMDFEPAPTNRFVIGCSCGWSVTRGDGRHRPGATGRARSVAEALEHLDQVVGVSVPETVGRSL